MALPVLSKLTVGTGGVGAVGNPEQLDVIRRVMDHGGLWMHCANYGEGSFRNLKAAFSERRSKVPKTIFKVDGITAEGFRTTLRDFLAQTGLEQMDIAQVCGFPLSREPEAVLEAMAQARRQGRAGSCIMEVVPAYCPAIPDYVRKGWFEGYVFYYNVLECAASEGILALFAQQHIPILAMRAFAGGDFFRGATAQHEALRALYREAGCRSEVDFCIRFALSVPGTVTAIAGTSKRAHLEQLIDAAQRFEALDPAIVSRVRSMLRQPR